MNFRLLLSLRLRFSCPPILFKIPSSLKLPCNISRGQDSTSPFPTTSMTIVGSLSSHFHIYTRYMRSCAPPGATALCHDKSSPCYPHYLVSSFVSCLCLCIIYYSPPHVISRTSVFSHRLSSCGHAFPSALFSFGPSLLFHTISLVVLPHLSFQQASSFPVYDISVR